MASVDKRPDGRWRARWREYAGGPQHTKHFRRKVDAEQHLAEVAVTLARGTYVEPRAGKVTVESYYHQWLGRMAPTWRPTTRAAVESSFRRHLLPALGGRPIASLRRSDIEAALASLAVAPGTVAVIRQHLGQLLNAAVEDGMTPRNVALGARIRRRSVERARTIPLDEIAAISAAMPTHLRIAIPLAYGAGLRLGESTGLTVDRVDFLRSIITVDRQLGLAPAGVVTFTETKTKAAHRRIPLASFLSAELAAHLSEHGRGEMGLILHRLDGTPINRKNFGDAWRRATKVADSAARYHDLRHSFASTLLSQGVSIRAVADWLGHASAKVTLDTYSHMMPIDEDRARSILDGAFSRSASAAALSPRS
jgi:integrase